MVEDVSEARHECSTPWIPAPEPSLMTEESSLTKKLTENMVRAFVDG